MDPLKLYMEIQNILKGLFFFCVIRCVLASREKASYEIVDMAMKLSDDFLNTGNYTVEQLCEFIRFWNRNGKPKLIQDLLVPRTLCLEINGDIQGLQSFLDEKISLKSGTSLVTNTNLNSLKTVGNYICTTDTISATIKNSPAGGKAFALKVGDLLNDGKCCYQEVINTTGASWRRTFNSTSNTWNSWMSISS